jgi:ABC-type histidine transport system ATPase subunit
MNFARQVANRVLFLDQGSIIEEGAPQQIFQDPQEPRTRSFIRVVTDR